ncbi:CobW family GTP-binding protein [Acetobacterium bakii]|uniref:Cobalamin biosynthesis protein CobW n=1 Tax=Acetobacterium bakii TaxID=52689 RepID=A0A0L6TWY6_9FIRM|nr:CobW family GTP-binding protein [Acetobacterium bakii]KNZ40763.1 cobalamin biosynthesis protein CobW [Acetobacterium bakii]
MTKIDIISGFLGAGKTTLIKKLLEEAFVGEKVVLIENEFGEIGIDGAILKDYGIEIKEMNSGCICCTIAGDFSLALKEMLVLYHPDRIIIEPSGVGKLSDVINGCKKFLKEGFVELNMCITVVDAMKYKVYLKNFAEFYANQLTNSKTIILSRSQNVSEEVLESLLKDMKQYNPWAHIVTTDWQKVDGNKIRKIAESSNTPDSFNALLNQHEHVHGIHHHADDVFHVWGRETAKAFERSKVDAILKQLDQMEGHVLRAKGIIRVEQNQWIQFDYVPEEAVVRETTPDFTGRICVIGEQISDTQLSELFDL